MSKNSKYCEKSKIENWDSEKYHYFFQSMKRIYVRTSIRKENRDSKRKLIPIGWICPICEKVELDKDLINLKGDYSKY